MILTLIAVFVAARFTWLIGTIALVRFGFGTLSPYLAAFMLMDVAIAWFLAFRVWEMS